MNRFAALMEDANRQSLVRYFTETSAEDAAWALWLLLGKRLMRAVSNDQLKRLVAGETALPQWLVEESYKGVGDWGETAALLLDTEGVGEGSIPLGEVMRDRIAPLIDGDEETKAESLRQTWKQLSLNECRLFHKLILGSFRSGLARREVIPAVAEAAGLESFAIAYRLINEFVPSAESFRKLIATIAEEEGMIRPCPFPDWRPLRAGTDTLGEISEWHILPKVEGLRVQLIKGRREVMLWSEDEEFVGDRFPEVARAGRSLSEGTILDGIMTADGFVVCDVLEGNGVGEDRGVRLLAVFDEWLRALQRGGNDGEWMQGDLFSEGEAKSWPVKLGITSNCASWEEADRERSLQPDGILLQGDGQTWHWQPDRLSFKCVLLAAQAKDGLYVDYSFGVWDGQELVSIGKAFGLTESEWMEIDAFVRANTREHRGPVRLVEPTLVFEISCAGVRRSNRHQARVTLRKPRIVRWLRDAAGDRADTVEFLRGHLN